jgi:WD40 repeat protein
VERVYALSGLESGWPLSMPREPGRHRSLLDRQDRKRASDVGYPTKVRELAWDHRSRYLATGGGPALTVWDCSGKGPAGTKPATLHFHRAPVTRIAYQHSGGTLATGCAHGQLALWKPSKRREPDAVASLSGGITDISWSADDRFVATAAEDGSVAVFSYPE